VAIEKLTETKIKKLKSGVHSDGGGLYLRVRESGSKSWLFIYRRAGKRTEVGLGGYELGTAPVSLSLAREKAQAIRDRLARGEDLAKRYTFADIMEDVIKVKEASFRNDKHKAQWRMTLDVYAAPLHKKPIAAITRDDVVETLKPIWQTKAETADRTRMRIAAVIDHAKARGIFTGDNPAEWKGGLKELLPARQKLTRGHHAAAAYKDIPAIIKKLRASDSVSAAAVEFTALVAGRSGEIRGAVWPEFDLDAALWVIPATRMKAGREHKVILSKRAIEILRARKDNSTGDIVFEGGKEGAPISDTAMTKSLRAASADKAVTIHGLRSSFSDWANDRAEFPGEVVEHALAHLVGNAVHRSYRRGTAVDLRRELMEAWAIYCGSAAEDNGPST